jgi:hypothetical protein
MRVSVLVGAFAVSAAAVAAMAPPASRIDDSWRLWGGPRRDFVVAATGLFPKSGEKWLETPPRKLWERALGDGYSGIAVEDGIAAPDRRRRAAPGRDPAGG